MNNLVSFKAVFRIKYNVLTAISGEDAIQILRNNLINIIITDQRMPHMTGVEFLESILDEYPDPIRILLTGYADMNAVIDAVNKGKIFHYLTKPWNEEELDMTITRAFDIYKEKPANPQDGRTENLVCPERGLTKRAPAFLILLNYTPDSGPKQLKAMPQRQETILPCCFSTIF